VTTDRRARLIVVRGRVQGVGFRASCAAVARRLGTSGWVRNRPDGTVEVAVIGPEPAVAELTDWCHHGPPAARVTDLAVTDLAVTDLAVTDLAVTDLAVTDLAVTDPDPGPNPDPGPTPDPGPAAPDPGPTPDPLLTELVALEQTGTFRIA
jgi:acylphosphatase